MKDTRSWDSILEVQGIDIVTAGLNDWAFGLGISGDEANARLSPKVERILAAASKAGKITTISVSSAEQAQYYVDLGVRIFFVGVDVAIKRRMLRETLSRVRDGLQAS